MEKCIGGSKVMCGGSTGSGSGGGSSGGSNSSLESYTEGSVSSMSKGEKLDKLDQIENKLTNESRQLRNDVRSGEVKAGSKEATNEVNRIETVSREVDIARDSVRGHSQSALEYKYNTSRQEGSKTSKSDIEKIRRKWGE